MNDTQYHKYRKRMNASMKLDLNMTHSEASDIFYPSVFVPRTPIFIMFLEAIVG
jgi:hypothetical protein